jgi:hypothetical protein
LCFRSAGIVFDTIYLTEATVEESQIFVCFPEPKPRLKEEVEMCCQCVGSAFVTIYLTEATVEELLVGRSRGAVHGIENAYNVLSRGHGLVESGRFG